MAHMSAPRVYGGGLGHSMLRVGAFGDLVSSLNKGISGIILWPAGAIAPLIFQYLTSTETGFSKN